MIKMIFAGIWACLLTLASTYFVAGWQAGSSADNDQDPTHGVAYEPVKTDQISVPVVSGGKVLGYAIVQFLFTADSEKLKGLAVPANSFLLDAAFKEMYAAEHEQLRDGKKNDLVALAGRIKASANARLKDDVIVDVLIEQLNYVAKDEVRRRTEH